MNEKNSLAEFSKLSLKSAKWLIFYVLTQVFSSVLIFFHNLRSDKTFVERFLKIFAPIYKEKWYKQEFSIEKNFKVMNLFNELMENFLLETLLISGVIILCFGIMQIKNNKKNNEVNIDNKDINFTGWQLILFLITGVAFNILISIAIGFIPKDIMESYDVLVGGVITSDIWLFNLIISGILTPIVEELIFRYGILGCFIHINPTLAVIYQALLFATMHGNPIQMIYTFFLGIAFGYTTYKTESIVPAIFLHISLNSSTIISVNIFKNMELFGLFYCIFVILFSVYIANNFVKIKKVRKIKNKKNYNKRSI